MIRSLWGWLKHEPADWCFLHLSRKPAARMLRDARRRIRTGPSVWLAGASEQHVRVLEEYLQLREER